jgi:hypothetical protein
MVVGVFGPSAGNGECLLTVNSDTQLVLAAEKDGDKPGHRAHGHPAPSRLGPLHNTLAFHFSIRYGVSVSRSRIFNSMAMTN